MQIYKNNVYLDSRAGYNVLDVTSLTPCTSYNFNVVGSGFGSSSTNVTTLGCPTAPAITYTTTVSSIDLSWTATNAVSYDIYKNGSLYATTSDTTYSVGAGAGQTFQIKIVAKNGTGATAQTTISATTQTFTATFVQDNLSGNIRVGGAFTNSNPTSPTSMNIALYRVTGSGDVYVGSTSVSIGANQSVGGWYPIATGQPLGTYKAVLTSQSATTSGASIGSY
ncbi:hypothetical protein KCTCHS21_22230 [Cohnella abietis]|uniref:Fibronectin type-III domain-containing protein n=1 Tax=Cohnella abietis TaxID=2507935 RepID=A0A3T1D406_9BACL|nr:hypothetical protein KCTCHS21_22230 [Cohnella abietis]